MIRGGRGVPSSGGRGKFLCLTQVPWELLARRCAPTMKPSREIRGLTPTAGDNELSGSGAEGRAAGRVKAAVTPAMPPRARRQLCLPSAGTKAAPPR